MADDDKKPEDDAPETPAQSAPVTHAELPGLLEDALTKFFGDKDPIADDPAGAGVVDDTPTPALPTLRDVEETAQRIVREAIAKLRPKTESTKTESTKEVIDAPPAKEAEPVNPVRRQWREKIWS